ncbi:uncharacterized protein LOC6526897 [Drosophila yakuba]|uniref:Uncharacterized protein n=1 Tax=Drosophila yakuba TaxID=7245 RepID=B4NZ44_DROYA|nr:uncharacterized protein LOC6526897 [Drosophila yakuba]EDW87708.1 uncharacterized protein Dyak_GE18330 [Drosophila yakuba]
MKQFHTPGAPKLVAFHGKPSEVRELQVPGRVNHRNVRICDRHNYFKNFDPLLKEAAFKVIRSDGYRSSQEKVLRLLSALKIKPSIYAVKSLSIERLICIELNCDFDVVLLALESQIYNEVIKYFTDMLV